MILVNALPLQTEHRYRGIGSYTAGLLDALTRLQAPLALLVQPPHPADSPLVRDLTARPGVEVVTLHGLRRPQYNRQWALSSLTVGLAVYRAQPRVYHATEPNGLVRVPGVRTVATLYDLIPLHYPDAHFPVRRPDQRTGYGRYLQRLQDAERLIAISEATKRDAVERLRIPPERIVVTPLAVAGTHFYARSAEEIQAVVTRYGLRRPYFLHVGASTYVKNTAAILAAFQQFCRDGGVEHSLYIAGRWNPDALADLQEKYGDLVASTRLRVLGFVPDEDLASLYGGADALVYPSLIEGFGLPILEAMRCAAPVLTSNTSSLPEVGGDAALYVDPHSIEEIVAGMQQLANHPALRADLIARGLRRAALFSFERTAEETLHACRELL